MAETSPPRAVVREHLHRQWWGEHW